MPGILRIPAAKRQKLGRARRAGELLERAAPSPVSAQHLAKTLGYHSAFTPARSTPADPVGALPSSASKRSLCSALRVALTGRRSDGRTFSCLLIKAYTPLTCMVTARMWRERELNRELCLELFSALAALGNRMIFILGDWICEPDDLPIDLVHWGQVHRPLSDSMGTSPCGSVKLDWILCSKVLLPACGLETATDKKPDYSAVTLAPERARLPLPGMIQSVYHAEFLAVVRALEECQPGVMVSNCKGVVKALGSVTAANLHGNGQADLVANLGTDACGPLAPDASWTSWADFANKVYDFWRIVGRQLRARPDSEPRVRLLAEAPAEDPADTGIVGIVFPEVPFKIGLHLRVVRHAAYLHCLECGGQTGTVKGGTISLITQAKRLPQTQEEKENQGKYPRSSELILEVRPLMVAPLVGTLLFSCSGQVVLPFRVSQHQSLFSAVVWKEVCPLAPHRFTLPMLPRPKNVSHNPSTSCHHH
eukprot:3733067-Amphidinium_carterae.1